MYNLENKKVVLTGGSRGIGLSILERLYNEKCKIIIIGTNLERLEEVKKKFQSIEIEQMDLSNIDIIQKNFEKIINKIGGLDVLINNAGITKDNLAIRMSKEEWLKVLDVNLNSVFFMCQQALKFMIKNKSGVIVNISSVVGHIGNSGQSNYTASKAGIIALSKSLAKEYAKKNIRINCISPGFVETDMTKFLKDEHKKMLLEQIPLNKIGKGEDIANAVAFLISDESSYITGETMHVNGGMYMA